MKNMSTAITRPVSLVTKTVSTPPRTSTVPRSNYGPIMDATQGPDGKILGCEDKIISPTRVVYENGF